MTLSISIISHGHEAHVRALLRLLAKPGATQLQRVWLTLNVPEAELADIQKSPWPFDLRVLINSRTRGFGTNHNHAFALERQQVVPATWFAVLNPDLTWKRDPLPALMAAAALPRAGCAYPLQVNDAGLEQDHRRELPTPWCLLKRQVLGQRVSATKPDWANAAMLLFPTQVYAALRGFDERYFLYCEDVDLCLRLQLEGYQLVEARDSMVVHFAQRNSHRQWRHLWWHLSGLLRLWMSTPYRRYWAKRRKR